MNDPLLFALGLSCLIIGLLLGGLGVVLAFLRGARDTTTTETTEP
jgi:hypothetical protein